MASLLVPLSLQTIFDNVSGSPVYDARVFATDAGTTTPHTVYQDAALSVPHPYPIPATGAGRLPKMFVGTGDYDLRITDGSGVLIDAVPGLPGYVAPSGGGGGGSVDATALLTTGDAFWRYGVGTRAGAIRLNAKTIGNASSGATERANADAQALFQYLWDADPNLTVSGGRGSTSAGDWAANKTIVLPDLRGRSPFGLDDMGNTAAGRLAAIAGTTLGTAFGESAHILLQAEMPDYTLTGSAFIQDHQHGGTTDVDTPDHTHAVGNTVLVSGGAGGSTVTATGAGANATGGANTRHLHNFTTAFGGSHTAPASIDSGGSGTAHNNLPPGVLVTWYMRL